jgi:hypothetical protein
MMASVTKVEILPKAFEYDGCTIYLLEVIKTGTPEYIAVVAFEYEGMKTRPFSIPFKTREELRAKILAEIAKLKMYIYTMGKDKVREVLR